MRMVAHRDAYECRCGMSIDYEAILAAAGAPLPDSAFQQGEPWKEREPASASATTSAISPRPAGTTPSKSTRSSSPTSVSPGAIQQLNPVPEEEAGRRLPGGGSSTFTTPWVKGPDLPCASHPRPVQDGVFHIEPDPPDIAQRQAARVLQRQQEERMRFLATGTPGKQWAVPSVYEERPTRADGFDQRQVDAARAALLAPASPRYPRSR
jgi:hypothetical protein